MGVTCGWRSTVIGVAAAAVAPAVIIALVSPLAAGAPR
jgi:hypothetical protein